MHEERIITLTLILSSLGIALLGWLVLSTHSDSDYGRDWSNSYKTIEVEIDGDLFEAIVRKDRSATTEDAPPPNAHAGVNFY